MEASKAVSLLRDILREIEVSRGVAATEKFLGLRAVDAKTSEAHMILAGVSGLPGEFLTRMGADENFEANSRRVRLETLAEYIYSAIKFLEAGGVTPPKKQIIAPPDYDRLTQATPGLQAIIDSRWREAQRCQHVKAYTSAVVMMGSVLEGLLLCRAQLAPSEAYQSPRAPKNHEGKGVAIPDWNLNALIEVAVDRGWVKSDRAKFSHAMRESRNVVHPWNHLATKANFDDATCRTSWEALRAAVGDLINSI